VYSKEYEKFRLNSRQKREFLAMVPRMAELTKQGGIHNWLEDFLKHDLIGNSTALQKINRYRKFYNSKGLSLACHLPLISLTIDWDGKLFGCPFSRKHAFSFDYTKGGSLMEFLKSEEYKNYRKKFINKRSIPRICKPCQICDINQINEFRESFEASKKEQKNGLA